MKGPRVYLEDILESIHWIERYTEGLDEKDFLERHQVQDAVLRRLEIIGEAVKHVPPEIRNANPDIRWRDIAGLRDLLIHAYSGVDPRRVWNILENDLPVLRLRTEEIVRRFERDK